jgi:hypothetical protein
MAATNIQRLDSNLPRDIRKEKGGPTIRRIPLHAITEQGLDRTSRNFGVTHESLLTELKLLGGGKIGAQKKPNKSQFNSKEQIIVVLRLMLLSSLEEVCTLSGLRL